MDRETPREAIERELCIQCGGNWKDEYTRLNCQSEAFRIAELPTIARALTLLELWDGESDSRMIKALKALADLEAGRLVRLAEDQSFLSPPLDSNEDETEGWVRAVETAYFEGFRRVELSETQEGESHG